jgi:glutathione-regulated potassium-efflux system ancillary protein KefF
MILIIYAHPYPRHSHANKHLLQTVASLDGVEIRSLYELYPDFALDVQAEQQALSRAKLVILQHPLQWYSMPPLLKMWCDKVLEHGWAYGHDGHALRGKDCLWAVTTGGDTHHFDLGGFPGFEVLAQPLQATALYCGMNWLPPFSVHNTFSCDQKTLDVAGERYLSRLRGYLAEHGDFADRGAASGVQHG